MSSETPSTPATQQPTAAETDSPVRNSAPAAAALTTRGNDTSVAPSAPGARPGPTAVQADPSTPSSPNGQVRHGDAADAAALSTNTVAGPAQPDQSGGAALTSARTWLTKVSNEFINSVATALREVTLKDLALAALPGIAGLMFVFLTGIGLGHRQARFGFVMETTGALRFAAGGPLGVVRPGGSIAVRTRRSAAPKPHGLAA